MKAKNILSIGATRVSVDSVVRGAEYSVRLPGTHMTMPVFEMTAEPKSDRRYFREGAIK